MRAFLKLVVVVAGLLAIATVVERGLFDDTTHIATVDRGLPPGPAIR
jgi:hypothetical protein